MTSILSESEIDDLLHAINSGEAEEAGAPIPPICQKLASRFRDSLAALISAEVRAGEVERRDAPVAEALAFPDSRYALAECGALRFLVSLGDEGMARFLDLVAAAPRPEAASAPGAEIAGQASAAGQAAADLYERFAAVLRAELPGGDGPSPQVVYPLAEDAFKGEEWGGGFSFPLSVGGAEPLVFSIYPTKSAAQALFKSPDQAAPVERRIKIYDFKRPDRFSKEQIRAFHIVHETFAHLATSSLSSALRSLTHFYVASVDQLTYEEFIRSIPTPTTLALFEMVPLEGQALLEIDPAITFALVDRLFGGRGEGSKLNRELTDIERSVMEGVIVRLLGDLREAWSRILDLRPRLYGVETNPQFAQIAAPTEMVALVSLEAKVGEVEGMMNICLPYFALEPVLERLVEGYSPDARQVGEGAHAARAIPAERLDALRLTRYALFKASIPSPTASELAARLAEARGPEFEALGRFAYEAAGSR
jgi:flagellar motor switch protein FliM